MNTLYIDFGNTRIKWCQQKKLQEINHSEVNDISALTALIESKRIDRIILASTRKNNAYYNMVDLITKCSINLTITKVDHDIFQTCYQNTESFGIDRYLNLLAVYSQKKEDFVVISAGSAITIDFYTKKHIGGIISPGLQISQEALHEKIGLPFASKKGLLGNDTQSSIGAGIYYANQFMVEKYIEEIEKKYLVQFQRVYTGGDAEQICTDKSLIQSNLTFLGIDLYTKKLG